MNNVTVFLKIIYKDKHLKYRVYFAIYDRN